MPESPAEGSQPGEGGQASPRASALSRAKPIFLAVRGLAPAERQEAISHLCGQDDELRARVEMLLSGDRAPLPFETLAEEVVAARDALGDDQGAAAGAGGTRIGPYRVLEKIGEGGFGVVYMAEQEEPVRRKVAIKILKLGMDTRQIVARFEAERQALAIMDHPAIAKVLDAGATPTGRPYFVMELVKGEPITEYCDARSMSISKRLELFALVCEGVQHAHTKGVIHRDIKPSNVLVCDVDGRASPKIIDFGIAKAISQRLTDKTLFTEFRQMIGTPEYMSPEQAERGPSGETDVDTRSDVYSLGVLLYELLAGSTPFDSKRLRSAAYAEIQRIIREEDPPRPSTRLSTIETLPSIAARRTIEPAKLGAVLKGELDWIVMRCLDKDRERRYGTAADLAADLTRFLRHEPVLARPISAAYQLRKFVRRNRAGVVIAGVILTLVAAGAAGTLVGLYSTIRANRKLDAALVDARLQRDLARTNERLATTQLRRAEQLTRFLRSMLNSANPSVTRGRDVSVLKELLERAQARIDGGELKNEPIVEADMRAAIADTYKALGDNTNALKVMEPALALADAAPEADQPAYLFVRMNAASLYAEWRRNDESMAQLQKILDVKARAGLDDDDKSGVIYTNIATLLTRKGKFDESLKYYERAKAVNERFYGKDSFNVASTMANIGGLLTNLGKNEEALAIYRQVIAIFQATKPEPLVHLAILEGNTAALLNDMGRFAEGEQMARSSLHRCAQIFKPDHQQTGVSWYTLGSALGGLNQHQEAADAFAKAGDILLSAFAPNHDFVIQCRLRQARHLISLERFADAEKILLAANEVMTPDPGSASRFDPRTDCAALLRDLYAAWDAKEPGKGYAQRSQTWAKAIDEAKSMAPKDPAEPAPTDPAPNREPE